MHIFISYAKVDTQPIALRIRDALRSVNGLTAWMDESLESGEDWAVQIQDEIDHCDLMLVLMSPDVNRATEPRSFVLREIHYAQDNRKAILPVMAQKTKIPVQLAGIQFVDLTQNQAAGIEGLVENVCRRVGVLSPAEQKRQAEEAERQRLAEIHRQSVEAEQKRQAQIAAQRQAEENERRRQVQIDAQRRADEQARQQQNAQTAPSIPVMQPRPNAPQDWDKQHSEGSSAAFQAKVSAAGPRKSSRAIPLLAGGAVLAALIIIVIVGLLLSGVLGGDDEKANNRYQLKFEDDSTVPIWSGNMCAFHNFTLDDGDVGKTLTVKLESTNSRYEQSEQDSKLFWHLYRSTDNAWQGDWTITEEKGEIVGGGIPVSDSLEWTIDKAGDYVICLEVSADKYSSFIDDSFWFTLELK
ncbi:MAG: TIR domain-containing protein [Anaerolineae bacterium]|nr:TIR domain-containing protein [Anaerolineae bacterium]